MEPGNAYSKKADDYALYRPPYAPEAMDAVLKITGLDSRWVVADVGSGTGNVSRHLVDKVGRVFAIEPNAEMRRHAENLLGHCPAFTSISATAEHTTLPDHRVDLITVGQACHWFDALAAAAEFDRILKPGGWLAVIWNRLGDIQAPDLDVYFRTRKPTHLLFPMSICENWQQFLGGARSSAGNPSPGDPEYDGFVETQRTLFDAQAVDGLITVKYTTELVVGQLSMATSPSPSPAIHPPEAQA